MADRNVTLVELAGKMDILFNRVSTLEESLHDIQKLIVHKANRDDVNMGIGNMKILIDRRLEDLESDTNYLENCLRSLQSNVSRINDSVPSFTKVENEKISQLEAAMLETRMNTNYYAQFLKRNNIRIYGLKVPNGDSRHEVCSYLNFKSGLNITANEISSVRRLPIPKSSKRNVPALIVSFYCSHVRDAILGNRKYFSFTSDYCNIFITEDLTTENSNLRIVLREIKGVESVLLKGCFIYGILSDGFKMRFLPTDNVKDKVKSHFDQEEVK